MFGHKAREKASRARKRLSAAMPKLNIFHNSTQAKSSPTDENNNDNNTTIDPYRLTPATPIVTTDLRVSVNARFEAPLDKNITHYYEASPSFEATEKVCQALLRRIEHCSRELITRPDALASHPLRYTEPRTKVARFHLSFRIDRRGQPWAERFFTSFQDVALNIHAAHEIVLEADRIVCQFLRAHDDGFEWELPAFVKEDPLKQRSASHEIGIPQAIHCIPSYEGTPGYNIELNVRTCCRGQTRSWNVKVDSQQLTPLTLHQGEKLMSQISAILHYAIKQKEERFDEIHEHCNSLESSFGCQHFAEGAFDVVAKIKNTIGPDYPHLSARFQSYRILLNQGTGTAFVQDLETQLKSSRDLTDTRINQTDDIVLTVHEMRSKDWKVYHPLSVTLDASILHCRKTTERVLDRIQSGLTHVLRGHGTAAVLTVHKRGHLVLETTICRGEDTDFYDLDLWDSLNLKKRELRKRMLERIQEDLAMVCKDTLSLTNPEHTPKLKIFTPDASELIVEPLTTRAEAVKKGLVTTTRRISKKSPLTDLRRRSLEEEVEATNQSAQQDTGEHMVQDYGYMADMVSERSDSLHIPTPSLADTVSDYLPEGAKTPQSAWAAPNSYEPSGLGIMNLNYDFPTNAETPSLAGGLAGGVVQSTSGTIVRHSQPDVKNATALLASYWEHCDSDSSHLEDSTMDVFDDTSKTSDMATGAAQIHETESTTKNNSAHDMITETTWLANKASFGADNSTQDHARSERHALAAISGNRTYQDQEKGVTGSSGPNSLARAAPVEKKKTGSTFRKFHTLNASETSSPAKSRALIVRGSEKRLNCYPRRSSAEAAPTQTLVHAQGLVQKRQFSYPAGGYLGLHGEWSIEMGLRNALVPPHLRTPLAE